MTPINAEIVVTRAGRIYVHVDGHIIDRVACSHLCALYTRSDCCRCRSIAMIYESPYRCKICETIQ